jgi:hypothetical protein
MTLCVIDKGVVRQAQVFVACLPCSDLTYAEAELDPRSRGLARCPCPRLRLYRRLPEEGDPRQPQDRGDRRRAAVPPPLGAPRSAAEMAAKARPRRASTRRADQLDNLSGPGAQRLGPPTERRRKREPMPRLRRGLPRDRWFESSSLQPDLSRIISRHGRPAPPPADGRLPREPAASARRSVG